MDDVIVRQRYPRKSAGSRRNKKSTGNIDNILVIITRQVLFSVLILSVICLVKYIDTNATWFLSVKIKNVITQNTDPNSLFEGIDNILLKVKSYISTNIALNTQPEAVQANAIAYAQEDAGYTGALNEHVQQDEQETNKQVQPDEQDISKQVQPEVGKKSEEVSSSIMEIKPTEKPIQVQSINKNTENKKYLIMPVSGAIGSKFGNRIHPIKKTPDFHNGIDIAANKGVNIKAAQDGDVVEAGVERTFGNYLVIAHADGYRTIYAHCSLLIAKRNQKVKQGDIIAKVGDTGAADGPHLHFEVWKDGKAVDPLTLINTK